MFKKIVASLCSLAICAACSSPDASHQATGSPAPAALLAAESESLTIDGFVAAIAMAAANNGLVIAGTVEALDYQPGEFSLNYQTATIQIAESYLGRADGLIRVRSADPEAQLEDGVSYLIVLGPDSTVSGRYNAIGGYIFDDAGSSWTSHRPDDRPSKTSFQVAKSRIPSLVDQARSFLAGRLDASNAVLNVELDGDVFVVTGYTPDAEIGLVYCEVFDGFSPAENLDHCDLDTLQVGSASGEQLRFVRTVPEVLETSTAGTVRCDATACAAVMFDLGWPGKVFRVLPIGDR